MVDTNDSYVASGGSREVRGYFNNDDLPLELSRTHPSRDLEFLTHHALLRLS